MGFIRTHLSEFITLLTAASRVQYWVQQPETSASMHRNSNGTSARGKVRDNTSKRNNPVWLPPVPWRPGLTIKCVNLRTLEKTSKLYLDISLRAQKGQVFPNWHQIRHSLFLVRFYLHYCNSG